MYSKLALKSIAIYQSIYALTIIYSVMNLIINHLEGLGLGYLVFYSIITFLFILVLITNVELIISSKPLVLYLKFNYIFSIFQIFKVKVLGLMLEISSGLQIIPYFEYVNNVSGGVRVDPWSMIFTLYYNNKSAGLYFGINLISVLILAVYYILYKKRKAIITEPTTE